MKSKTILIIVLLALTVTGTQAQSLIELKKQIAETNYQKGNFYVSAFPIFSGHFGRPGTGIGFNAGHSVSFGYFVADRLSVNLSSSQAFGYNRYLLSDYTETYTHLYASPSFSMRWYVLNKRCTPYVEAGFNNMLMYSEKSIYNALEGFQYTGSVFGALGITIPLSNFNIGLTAKYLLPVVDNHPNTRYYAPYTYGFQFEPAITYYFNKNRKKVIKPYKFD